MSRAVKNRSSGFAVKNVKKVSEEEVTFTGQVIPYEDLVEILKKGDRAFIEAPLKRQTAYYAAKSLSKKLGFKVIARKAGIVLRRWVEDDEYFEEHVPGYVFEGEKGE